MNRNEKINELMEILKYTSENLSSCLNGIGDSYPELTAYSDAPDEPLNYRINVKYSVIMKFVEMPYDDTIELDKLFKEVVRQLPYNGAILRCTRRICDASMIVSLPPFGRINMTFSGLHFYRQ